MLANGTPGVLDIIKRLEKTIGISSKEYDDQNGLCNEPDKVFKICPGGFEGFYKIRDTDIDADASATGLNRS